MLKYQDQIAELSSLGRYIMNREMTWGNAGNISIRTAQDSCLITISGSHLGNLSDGDFIQCDLDSADIPDKKSGKKPSKEWGMHQGIYQMRADINVVIHASPFYSTLVSAAGLDVPNDCFVEGMYYLERIERVPYYHPGSKALAEEVSKVCQKSNIILLENHGVVVYDKSVKEAKTALTTLEVACKMLITAKSAGISICSLSPETVDDFLNNSGYKLRREWG